ncbi:hypothetical protein GLAREA_04891 [Glarea lozoyensis ATCC 20868]|uniref:DUF5672 domain-containing protein n=1 Tax=Glarea lozoyensis (strain ATCC 20868 / MF5171) TaxID=1116229 RepID=S3CQZ8_GLAL2|nr:uncharacterized protein GLAREA_04891 [Glarea lozoyensis ATCC 20868]EPE28100.1 hypothetical protein GLAREA_04891 [Glarea lozoyensis ATCC 20868]
MARPRSFFIVPVVCALLLLLTSLWYHNRNSDSPTNFLGVLRPAILAPPFISTKEGFPIRDKVAVIVETRPTRNLLPIILHFASVLGPEWPIIFLTRESVINTLQAHAQGSHPFKRIVKSGQVKIIELPSDPPLLEYEGVSHFLASEWFWNLMNPAKHMLLFQVDSMICANSGRKVEDFFEWDFVGAAHPFWKGAFNGGLALRNVSLSQEVVRRYNISDDVNEKGNGLGMFEDAWFWDKMKDMGGHFPSPEKAGEFAVDYIWSERPLGFHGINKNEQVARAEQIYEYCPEAMLAASGAEVKLNDEELKIYTPVPDGPTEGGRRLDFV